jgi:cyclopropane-fatty-acyl-phospholipid synthase
MRALRALPRHDGARGDGASPEGARRRARLAGSVRHTRERDASAVRHHYDVSNDFYRLFLDHRCIYSCAYFPPGSEDLDDALEAKLVHICRKLRLGAGERLLDVGCGWGGLLEYAATRFGIAGVGITLSEPQAEAARERLAAVGVGDRVRIEVRDYRDLPLEWRFDKAVSVGMREHVGEARLPDYYAAVHRALRAGGLFLDHAIGRAGASVQSGLRSRVARRGWQRDAVIVRYVFPDGELVPLGPVVTEAERAGFEVRDVENLREHYARTLGFWVERLERAHDRAVALVGERTYRVWRLYMAASRVGFHIGRMTLIQTLLAKPHDDGVVELPPSRADLYGSAAR